MGRGAVFGGSKFPFNSDDRTKGWFWGLVKKVPENFLARGCAWFYAKNHRKLIISNIPPKKTFIHWWLYVVEKSFINWPFHQQVPIFRHPKSCNWPVPNPPTSCDHIEKWRSSPSSQQIRHGDWETNPWCFIPSLQLTYCWWNKNCTTWDVSNHVE